MTTSPGRELNWYPVSKLGWFTGHIREGITATRRQLELLQPARSQPYLPDDAAVARIIGAHQDQAVDLDLFQDQADRRKASPGLTQAQRAGVPAYEALIAPLREVNSGVAAAGLAADGTIETVLARSGLEPGIEALLRGLRPEGVGLSSNQGALAGLPEDAADGSLAGVTGPGALPPRGSPDRNPISASRH
ncbi:MAG TPA: hypothetical protein VEH31_27560 [Streptosporangiaceae bacterium]|nr:hypothetical protein [Streptosporangiaceae bacterium]